MDLLQVRRPPVVEHTFPEREVQRVVIAEAHLLVQILTRRHIHFILDFAIACWLIIRELALLFCAHQLGDVLVEAGAAQVFVICSHQVRRWRA